MPVLTPSSRNRLRDAVFGLPAQRKYPMENASHAANAKARAAQQLAAGNLSQAEHDQIVAKANRILGQ